jgi:hypothetical protein
MSSETGTLSDFIENVRKPGNMDTVAGEWWVESGRIVLQCVWDGVGRDRTNEKEKIH